jgi:hypothetical protein
MSDESRPREAASFLGSAIWTLTSASILAEILLALSSPADGPGTLREVVHPESCHACAVSMLGAGDLFDAPMIGSGAIGAPATSGQRPNGAGPASQAASDGP